MPDNINNQLISPKLAEMASLNPNDTRMEVAPLSRPSQGPMDSDRNISGTGIPATGHFMGDALEWLKRATTPHTMQGTLSSDDPVAGSQGTFTLTADNVALQNGTETEHRQALMNRPIQNDAAAPTEADHLNIHRPPFHYF